MLQLTSKSVGEELQVPMKQYHSDPSMHVSPRLGGDCRRALDSLAEELLAAAAAVLTSGAVLHAQNAVVTASVRSFCSHGRWLVT